MQQIFNGVIYNVGDSSDIRLKVWYEHRRNGNAMEYRFKWQMYLTYRNSETPNPYAWYSDNRRFQLFLNGSNVYTDNRQENQGWNTGEVTTQWFSIANKTSGTTPFYFYALDTQNTSWLNYVSPTYQLDIDPAGSVIESVDNFTIGTNFDITSIIYESSYTNTLNIKIGSTQVATRTIINTTTTITFNSTELNAIYNATKTSQSPYEFSFELSTYDNQTQIGETSIKKANGTLTNANPTIDSVGISINSPVQDNGNVIKGVSNVSISVTVTPKYNATIKSIKVNNQNATVSGSIGTLTILKSTTGTYNIVVEDSRGYKTTQTATKTLINYVPLSLSATLQRTSQTSGEVLLSYSGNYWSGNFGGESNTLTCSWKYREKGSSTWINGTTLSPTINTSQNTYSQTSISLNTLLEEDDKFFNYQKDYEFLIIASDKISTLQPQYSVVKGLGILELYKTTALINGNLDVTGENSIQDIAVSQPTHNPDLWIKYSKNLFDKDNYNVINAYIATNTNIVSEINNKTIYIQCEPNTTYTITKMVASPQSTNRFRIGTTSVVPQAGGTVSGFYNAGGDGGDVTTCTYTTDSSAKYLAITIINRANSSTTLAQMVASLQIQRGSEATPYEEYLKPSINVYDGGEYVPISTGGGESLPLGTIVKYDGNTVPDGYEQVDELPTYSTDETICGTWIDGSPLYRKVMTFDNISISSSTVLSNSIITNLSLIVDARIIMIKNDNNDFNIISKAHPSSMGWMIGAYYTKNSGWIIEAGSDASSTTSSFIIITEYTKTS